MQAPIELLYDVSHATVSEHIGNILSSGELDQTSVGNSDKSTGGRKPKIYNLDMILSIGYRVNGKRGIAFRKWVNSVLKAYMLKGYAISLFKNGRKTIGDGALVAITLMIAESDPREKDIMIAMTMNLLSI